jgi:hypothetical protein
MKREQVIYIFLVLLFALLVLILVLKPEPISWNTTLSSRDKIPFGSRAVTDCLEDVFPGNPVVQLRIPPSEAEAEINTLSYGASIPVNYLFIQPDFYCERFDALALLNLAEKGHHVFISARSVSGLLADTLGVSVELLPYELNLFTDTPDTLFLSIAGADSLYAMKPGDNDLRVTMEDESLFQVWGKSAGVHPVFVSRKWGKGQIFIHSVPLAFTNYYLFFSKHADYVSRCLSVMPNGPVLWDEFYKQGRREAGTPLRVILAHPSLRYALGVLLLFSLLFILIQSKRRQRVIPVIEPFVNTTLQFVTSVAALYRSRADHADMLKKQIGFFADHVRRRYRISPDFSSSASAEELAMVSGADRQLLQRLYQQCLYYSSATRITEKELLEFNRLLNRFREETSSPT